MVLSKQQNPEAVVKEIRRQTRRKFSTEEKIRIVLEGLRGEVSIAELCRSQEDVPVGRDCRQSLLPLEQGVPGSWEEAFARGYGARCDQW